MTTRSRILIAAAVFAVVWRPAWAQTPQFATLEIEWENAVTYFSDTADPTKLATVPTMVPPSVRNFMIGIANADIVSVNGKPARGTWIGRAQFSFVFPNPMPGQGVGDIGRPGVADIYWEILKSDGTPVGTITGFGSPGGPAVPGLPTGFQGTMGVTGGTGAFLGARGRLATPPFTFRAASMQEDPVNRRTHGGGRGRHIIYLIPATRPEIITTGGAPAVVHASDFSLVTASKPAAPGEILSVFATGLGPVRPGLEPGRPFPSEPLHEVNSPLELLVNGGPAGVLAAVGYPGSVDSFQVNFRLPEDTTRGQAALQLSAAWITGPEVRIAVQ